MNGSAHVLLALLFLAAVSQPASALKCYACRMKQNISGINLAAYLKGLKSFPMCDTMEEEGPSDKFEQTCSANLTTCANIVDPNDPTNRVRTCFGKIRDSPELPYCHKTTCYCGEDLCNSSGVMVGSVAMTTTVLAMLRLVGW